MLVVYTPQDTVDCEGDRTVGLASTSWCREMAAKKIRRLVTHSRIENFSVYGIIDGRASHRPTGIRSHIIGTHDPIVGNLVPLLFHTVLELASSIFLDTEFQWTQWANAWYCLRPDTACLAEGAAPYTIDVGDPEGIGYKGSIINLPAWVGKSIPLASFLLYLPRIWYNLTLLGYEQSQASHRKIHCTREETLLSGIAVHLAAPLYHMPYGRASFWSFLDFLITAASHPEYSAKTQDLLADADCSGYASWMCDLEAQDDLPQWCEGVLSRYKIYQEYGPCALVRPMVMEKTL